MTKKQNIVNPIIENVQLEQKINIDVDDTPKKQKKVKIPKVDNIANPVVVDVIQLDEKELKPIPKRRGRPSKVITDENPIVEEGKKKCSKCGKICDLSLFQNIRSAKITATCLNCRVICYDSYKKNEGYTKNSTFTKNKKIEYLCNIIKNEVSAKKMLKYNQLSKFGLIQNKVILEM